MPFELLVVLRTLGELECLAVGVARSEEREEPLGNMADDEERQEGGSSEPFW